MRYIHQNKPYKQVDGSFEPRIRTICKVAIFYSAMVTLIGIAIAIIFNVNRYDAVVGDPMNVDVAVYTAKEFQVEDEQSDAKVTHTVYKPVGNFTYQGYSVDIPLGEGYSSLDIAQKEIGEIRHVVVDSATLEEVPLKPFNWFGTIIAGFGLIAVLIFSLMLIYYSKWNESYSGRQFENFRVYG